MTASKQGSGLDRRDFLKGFATAGIAAGLIGPGEVLAKGPSGPPGVPPGQFGRGLLPSPTISGPQSGEAYWAKVRNTFSLPDDYIQMNTGTTGSPPQFVVNNLAVYNRYKAEDPRDWGANLAADFPTLFPTTPSAMGARQALVASVYGANPNEIVLSYNTTDGCNLIFAGTPWKKGDRIVTTSFEHPALNGPIAWARDHHGVEVVIVDIPSNFTEDMTVADVLDWFEPALSAPLAPGGEKQYLAISDIFFKNGLRLPVEELVALARSYGAYSIVDTAHGWGMLPIDCHAYGADFIAGAGHKWLCGGPGTGILYVRNSGADLPPFAMGNFFAYGNPFVAPSANFGKRTWNPASLMQSRGESNTPALYAMTDAVSYFDRIGVTAIYDRGVALGNYLKARIAAQWGPSALWVQENPDARFATALTSFNPFANKDTGAGHGAMNTAISAVNNALAAETPKIYIRSVTWRSSSAVPADDRVGFRISTHGVYNNYAEIDYVFDRLVHHINQSGLAQL